MTALKAIALLATLLVSSLGVAPTAAATDMSPEGLEWKRVSEDNLFMTAVAYSKGSKTWPVAMLVQVSSRTFTTGIDKTQIQSDYAVRQVNFDCSTRGRHKVWKNWSYLVGRAQPVKLHPLTETWEVATSFNGPLAEWKIVCGEEAAESLTSRPTFDAITADYRARYAQKKARDEADKKERQRRTAEDDAKALADFSKAQMSPEIATARAFGPGSHHWHYAFATSDFMGAVDVHRVVPGSSANLKRMSTALFVAKPVASGPEYPDYVIKYEEFDCKTPGKTRSIASAYYRKGGQLLSALQAPDEKWTTYDVHNPMSRFWEWACQGDQKVKALQANQGFDALLDMYREQVQ